MCGRFVRKRVSADYAARFGVLLPELPPSYNIAPSRANGAATDLLQLRAAVLRCLAAPG